MDNVRRLHRIFDGVRCSTNITLFEMVEQWRKRRKRKRKQRKLL
jgi:hypothetical protein